MFSNLLRGGASLMVRAQVDQGETQIINVRETDARLGPLVFTLIALGCACLVATAVFWWLTRPRRLVAATTQQGPPQGDSDG